MGNVNLVTVAELFFMYALESEVAHFVSVHIFFAVRQATTVVFMREVSYRFGVSTGGVR